MDELLDFIYLVYIFSGIFVIINYTKLKNIFTISMTRLTGHNDKTKIFCLSFTTNLNDNVIIYYIDKDINSDERVLKLIDELFRPKYKDIRFFC